MPSQKRDVSFPGYDGATVLQLAYGAVQQLGWLPRYAAENILVAHTPRNWKTYNDEITIETRDNGLTITSSLIHGESFDLLKKNKKHIRDFEAAIATVKSAGINPAWEEAIEQLKQKTVQDVNEAAQQAVEIDKTMHFSGSNLYLTYSIIAINILVFILMAINGAGIIELNPTVHVNWGSNYSSLTLSGDWWRLLTSVFIHFGIIHLAMNAYAFYMAGVYLEPMLGKARYIVAYLCTGVLASLTSLWWHKEGVNSAGASGAIFGMYGVFLALLFTNLIPKQMRTALLQSIGVFVVYNLVYGMKSGVDNAAHIGGLVSGLIIGFVYYLTRQKEDQAGPRQIVLVIIAAATALITWWYLDNNSAAPGEREAAKNYMKDAKFKDNDKMLEKFGEFSGMEEKALAPLSDTTLNNQQMADELNKVQGEWDKANSLLNEMKSYDISEEARNKISILIEYVAARKNEINIISRIAKEEKSEDYEALSAVRKEINNLLEKLQSGN
jgi:rhomboid protease GluP